jgi:hypothetical protein
MEFDLSPEERELFDDINVTTQDTPTTVHKPPPSRGFRQRVAFADDADAGGDDDDVDAFANTSKMSAPQQPPPVEFDGGERSFNEEPIRRSIPTGPSDGYKSIDDEKADLLNRIARLAKKGLHTSARLTVYSDIDDIRAEYKRLMYSVEVEQSIKFQRRMLVACVSGIEFLNKRFDPFDLELDGWSENIIESQEDYDTVFEQLFQKYRTKVNVAPEIKLMFMVGGSAMMFHMSKTMFKSFTEPPVSRKQAPPTSTNSGERREMRGPGIDLSSLSGGIDLSSLLGTLKQQQQAPPSDGDMSDIVSIASEIRELDIPVQQQPPKKRAGGGRRTATKKELVIE